MALIETTNSALDSAQISLARCCFDNYLPVFCVRAHMAVDKRTEPEAEYPKPKLELFREGHMMLPNKATKASRKG